MNGPRLKRVGARITAVAGAIITVLATGDTSPQFDAAALEALEPSEFRFVRLAYPSPLNYYGRDPSLTDWPEAEQFLLGAVRRLTRVASASEGINLKIMDDRLFDHPWLYAVEVGQWSLSDEEAARLRDYLLRGGFLVVDDFHGTSEWDLFIASMHKVFPDRAIVDIPPTDPIFHVVYDIDERIQIPGYYTVLRGSTFEKGGVEPQWRGIYDDDGKLMVVINFNMDLGDAWEHADVPEYALQYSTRAYKYAINYIVYAMTH
jgi:hypothetical protein